MERQTHIPTHTYSREHSIPYNKWEKHTHFDRMRIHLFDDKCVLDAIEKSHEILDNDTEHS